MKLNEASWRLVAHSEFGSDHGSRHIRHGHPAWMPAAFAAATPYPLNRLIRFEHDGFHAA